MKRIVFSDQAKIDIRAIPKQEGMQILTAIQRLPETGKERVRHSKVKETRSACGLAISGFASR